MRRILTLVLLVAMAAAQAVVPVCRMGGPAGTDGAARHAGAAHVHGAAAPGSWASAATVTVDATADARGAGVDEGPLAPHPEGGCGAAMACATVMIAAVARVAAAPPDVSAGDVAQLPGSQRSADLDHRNPPPRPLA